MEAKILDELCCEGCGKQLSPKQPLFDTAWSGVYWCGKTDCALAILEGNGEELNAEDKCNHEWDCACLVCR